MKKLWKRSAVVTLLLSAALLFNTMGGAAMASDPEMGKGKAVVFSAGMSDGFFMHSDVHQQAYLTYLVKEYAPETEAEWKEAFAQRNKVTEEMRDKIEAAAPENKPGFHVKTGIASETGKVFEKKLVMEDKIFSLPSPDDEQMQQIEAEMELQEEFARAVEDRDADAIRAVLPKLLENYKEKTARLPEMAENIKFIISEEADAAGE